MASEQACCIMVLSSSSGGSLRVQIDCARKIAIITHDVLKSNYAASKKDSASKNANYDDTMKFWKDHHQSKELSKLAQEKQLHHSIIVPGELVFTPAGSIVAECAHQNMRG